jgi:transcriptional regulator with XRE-family HTH domain
MNNSENTIHERLRLAREQAGLSQGQIARLMDYHRPTISEIEAGRRKVTSDELTRFAKHYGVSASWLLNEEESETNPAVELAARELSNLNKDDLDKILRLLRSLKKSSHPKE